MSRRIALVVTALLIALLALAVVPLGLSLTANDRNSLRFDAESAAAQLGAQAEEYLSDHDSPAPMYTAVNQAAARGDCAAVYSTAGTLVAHTSCAAAQTPAALALLARTQVFGSAVTAQDGDWVLVAVAVGDDGRQSGTAVLARSAVPLNDRMALMWLWLALTGLGVLAVGVLLAVRLARWATGPLDELGRTATRLGAGDLAARAHRDAGPREVRALAEVFNTMAERTAILVDGQRAWVADVSHQLRTPLTALRLRLDLLADGAQQDAAAELAGVQDEVARFSRLVDGLLAVARAEASVPRREPVRADLAAVERVEAWEPVAQERGVTLAARTEGPAAALLGPGDLEQILDNLIANALEAVPDGGRILVTCTRAEHGRIAVRVVDDGPGMSPQARAAAFHRFGGAAGGPRRAGDRGSGLGLAIVHRLAAADGGGVELAETPGGGLTVLLELPGAGSGTRP